MQTTSLREKPEHIEDLFAIFQIDHDTETNEEEWMIQVKKDFPSKREAETYLDQILKRKESKQITVKLEVSA